MKRSLSESDLEDEYDDDLKSRSPSQSCHVSDRKKRRGIIEKRRRDRINTSLSELRRLVPTAFEKQGSAKLEKAEILQMTVDHLKMLHQKGINGYNYPDVHTVAMDYRGLGFRECASEVARYLASVECLDLQDPLRMRLLGHLQCYLAQRDIAAKATTALQTQQWSATAAFVSTNQYGVGGGNNNNNAPLPPSTAMFASTNPVVDNNILMGCVTTLPSATATSYADSRLSQSENLSSFHDHMRISSTQPLPTMPVSSTNPAPIFAGLHSQFPSSLNSMLSPSNGHYNHLSSNMSHNVKPYRPWGAELAY